MKSECIELYTYMTGTMCEWRATLPFSCERFIVPRLCIRREINVLDYSSKLWTSSLSLSLVAWIFQKVFWLLMIQIKLKKFLPVFFVIVVIMVVQLIDSVKYELWRTHCANFEFKDLSQNVSQPRNRRFLPSAFTYFCNLS